MTLVRRRVSLRGCAGSILLEVVLATVLVGVLVVPLATAFAGIVGHARVTREQMAAAPQDRVAAPDAWEWGPRVLAGWWQPGPVLYVRVSGDPRGQGAERHVGLWADGWLVAEQTMAGAQSGGPALADELQMGPGHWAGLAGSELVVRVRTGDGAWGPPWRLAVPAADGGDPVPGSLALQPPQTPAAVVHRPGMGTSSMAASWSASPLAAPPFALVLPLSPAVQGWGGATLDGRSQWWWMEDGRSVDLYF